MNKLMNILLLSCQKATELLEKKLHVKLSFLERLQMKLHIGMCDACKSYEKQNIELESLLKNQNKEILSDISLSDEFKDTLKGKLK